MITPNRTPWQPAEWQKVLRNAFRQPDALLAYLGIPASAFNLDSEPDFALLVPEPFAARMKPGDPADPLLRQVLPSLQERERVPGFVKDPLGEDDSALSFQRAPALIQKYLGRVLMITTPGCAVNCRYCFRRHFPYQDHKPRGHSQALDLIRSDTSISEVLLSGGDPLLLGDLAFTTLIDQINAIEHVKRIRVHSRLPIVLPQRVTPSLVETIQTSRCPVVMVVHCNHPQELDAQTKRALACLRDSGAHVLNQSVLLAGINDDAGLLCQLSQSLFEQGVLPYYLHMPDAVSGTAHFAVAEPRAMTLHEDMRAILPGYLLPRLVREVPGKASKTPLQPDGLQLVDIG